MDFPDDGRCSGLFFKTVRAASPERGFWPPVVTRYPFSPGPAVTSG